MSVIITYLYILPTEIPKFMNYGVRGVVIGFPEHETWSSNSPIPHSIFNFEEAYF